MAAWVDAEQQIGLTDADAGLGGGGDGGGGTGGGGDGGGPKGGGIGQRAPQSTQSEPYAQLFHSLPGPPSEHSPSEPSAGPYA